MNKLVFAMNMERTCEMKPVYTQVDLEFRQSYEIDASTQTTLESLISKKFDVLFQNISHLEEAAENLDYENKLNLLNNDQIEKEI